MEKIRKLRILLDVQYITIQYTTLNSEQ